MLVKPLYPYQDEPVDRFLLRGNLLVAFEMGLGKTPVAIACAEELLGCGDIDCALIVCPASLKYHWAMKIAEFTDLPSVALRVKNEHIIIPRPESCRVIDGTPVMRRHQYDQIARSRPEYIIMGYETVVRDARHVRALRPGFTVLDECTAIKSFRAKRTKQVKRLLASPYRLGLTGTPVENRPEELYSIMQWVDADALGRYDLFDRAYIQRDHYGRVASYRNLPILHKRLAPAIARKSRLDPGVAPYLPTVEHGVWPVGMDTTLTATYQVIAADLLTALRELPATGSFDLAAYYTGTNSFEENSALGKVMARQTALEMLLDHPRLLVKSAVNYLNTHGEKGSKYLSELLVQDDFEITHSSPKLDYLTGIVPEILEFDPRNKIIIFSRFVGMQDIFEDELTGPDWTCVRFHGGLNAKEKAAAVAKFSGDPECRIFLSSHAGAYGNDMHMANYLINYDLPWSAGKAAQINGRHVRASSKFASVCIRDLIVTGTIEERRQQMLAIKFRVGSAILDGHGQDTDGAVVNDLKSLMSHLTQALGGG